MVVNGGVVFDGSGGEQRSDDFAGSLSCGCSVSKVDVCYFTDRISRLALSGKGGERGVLDSFSDGRPMLKCRCNQQSSI